MIEQLRQWLRRRREQKDERLAARWVPLAPYVHNQPTWGPGLCVGMVVRYGPPATTGTKAYVRWPASGQTTAAWFEAARVPLGSWVLAYGSLGRGNHDDDTVFYVHRGNLRAVVPPACRAAWVRREQRRTSA